MLRYTWIDRKLIINNVSVEVHLDRQEINNKQCDSVEVHLDRQEINNKQCDSVEVHLDRQEINNKQCEC